MTFSSSPPRIEMPEGRVLRGRVAPMNESATQSPALQGRIVPAIFHPLPQLVQRAGGEDPGEEREASDYFA